MMSLLESRLRNSVARQFTFRCAYGSTVTVEYKFDSSCWLARCAQTCWLAKPVPWSWINQSWFIRPDTVSWAVLKESDEALVNARELLALSALPHWENAIWRDHGQRERTEWSYYGETHTGNLCNKVDVVILHTCLAYRIRQGSNTLTYISKFGPREFWECFPGHDGFE